MAFSGSFHKILSGPLKGKWWSLSISDSRYLTGTYESETSKLFINNLSAGQVVYDIGANAGYFSLLSSELVKEAGKVYAFEPLPVNIHLLRAHLAKNAATNIEVVAMALSDQAGEVDFSDSGNSSANTLVKSSSLYMNSRKIKVRTISLDEFVFGSNNVVPALLKIDVEGAELSVLNGARKVLMECRPLIVLATHDCHVKDVSASCLSLLKDLNYKCEKIADTKMIEGQEDFICYPS